VPLDRRTDSRSDSRSDEQPLCANSPRCFYPAGRRIDGDRIDASTDARYEKRENAPADRLKTEGEGNSDEVSEKLGNDLGNLHDRGDVGVVGNVGHNGSGAF
jgi:hypothetical protein